MAKIGIFGGTFNPPHLGHLQAAEEARRALGLDRVLFIPDAQPPHKDLPQGSPDGKTRMEMVRAAIRGLPWAQADELELDRAGKSYTADTMALLDQRYPSDTLYLLMGTDMFLTLHAWRRPEEICRHGVIAVLRRKGDDRTEELLAQKARLERDYGAQVEIVENRILEISSTQVRRMLILGGAAYYLPPVVLEIILRRGLYNTDQDYRGLPMERLRAVATGLLKPKRVSHVLGCAQTAKALARRYDADETAAQRAGLLHDVTKALDGEDQLHLTDIYGIVVSDFERRNPKLLHGKTGAAVAGQVFGESQEIQSAIFWHTTGHPDMTLLEKIIYLADYIEPTRSFPGVEELRVMAMEDLDRTLLKSFDMVMAELRREQKPLCQETPAARAYLADRLGVD